MIINDKSTMLDSAIEVDEADMRVIQFENCFSSRVDRFTTYGVSGEPTFVSSNWINFEVA